MMNMILSVIMCFAMIFSGTGSLPAIPETANTLTIRNITIDNGQQSVTLTPEARITSAIGAQEALLHFEIGSGEEVILPASGKISTEGVQFELGDSGNSYSISADTLMEMFELSTDDLEALNIFAEFFRNYGALLGKAVGDPQFNMQFSETAMNALLAINGVATETEVQIDGEIYPADEIQLELNTRNMMEMMDTLRGCGIPEVEALFDSCLKLVCITEAEEYSSFADMAADQQEDMNIPVRLVFAQQDGFAYEAAIVEMTDEASGMTINAESEAITRGEETNMTMSMGMGDDSSTMVYEIEGTFTGPMEAPTAMNLECGMYMGSGYVYPAEGENEEAYISNSEASMFVTIESETRDGLDEMKISAMVESYDESGFESEIESSEQSFTLDASCLETLEADGSITAAWKLGTDIAGQEWTLAFELNNAQGDVADYFANATDYALTAEALNGEGEEIAMLGTDAMNFVSGAYALTMDESVMELVNMLTAIVEEYTVETEAAMEEVVPDKDLLSVTSLEEAAEIFGGKIPEFTVPEGFEPGGIYADDFSLNTSYANGDKGFDVTIYNLYDTENFSYNLLTDGKLAPLDDYIAEILQYDGVMESATIYNMDGISMYFYFYGMENAEVESILASLK